MAPIRVQFGQEPIACADYSEALSHLDLITVDVQVTSEFFDPTKYAED